jgi:type VI secretion system protein ImpK
MGVGSSASLADFMSGSGNPILQAAAPLLTLASRLQTVVQQANLSTLRQQAVHEIRTLEDRLSQAGVSHEDSLVARYVLCTFVDSAVANTPWGAQGDWSGQSLLVMFHKEVSGGEKFFQIIDRVRVHPERYLNLIELLYVCLALGYEGKYRQDPGGPARLADLQRDLFRIIRESRGLRDEPLSVNWQGVQDRRNPVIRYVPWWIVGVVALAAIVFAFFFYQRELRAEAEPIKAALAAPTPAIDYPVVAAAPAAPETVATPVAAEPPKTNRLKALLQPEESAGVVTVEEIGDKTVVTLTAPNLFRSGSARVNPEHYLTLRAVGQAIEQAPGHVVIVGHTDDLPVRSFQFADNFELSRERAVSVAGVMRPVLSNFGRVEWQGVGSTQPRYQPVDVDENRARNRRVEIVHATTRDIPP